MHVGVFSVGGADLNHQNDLDSGDRDHIASRRDCAEDEAKDRDVIGERARARDPERRRGGVARQFVCDRFAKRR